MTARVFYVYAPGKLTPATATEVEALCNADEHTMDGDRPVRAEYVVIDAP